MKMNKSSNVVVVLLGLAVVVLLVIAGPLLLLWSLNTLFPALAIPYNFWTWVAVIFLVGALKTKVTVEKK